MPTPVVITSAGGGPVVAAADILAGTAVATNSVTPVTLITVPAGRVWKGQVTVSIASTAAAIVAATVDTAGTGVAPAAGTIVGRVNIGGLTSGAFCDSQSFEVCVSAPSGNVVTLRLINTSATANTSSATANGVLL